jgi:hypothetical protein
MTIAEAFKKILEKCKMEFHILHLLLIIILDRQNDSTFLLVLHFGIGVGSLEKDDEKKHSNLNFHSINFIQKCNNQQSSSLVFLKNYHKYDLYPKG